MPQMVAFALVIFILYIGDVVSIRTKAWIPSVFVCAALFLFGYWTFFPKDIVSIAGIPGVVATLLMYLLVTNMGTLLSLDELKRQWKTVLISLSGICGICALAFGIGTMLFDWNTVVVAVPPLVGGLVSALLMSAGAANAGLEALSVLAIITYVMQGFAGYPLTAIMLQKEGKRVLKEYRSGNWKESAEDVQEELRQAAESESDMPRLFSFIPAEYNTSYFRFLRLGLVALLAWFSGTLVPVHGLVFCLVYGVIATHFGFLEKQPLAKANGFGFAVMGLMLFIFDTLKNATPEMLAGLVLPLLVLIGCAVVGMYITSWIVGRALKVTTEMGYAICLTALYGFPADYIIANEAINSLTQDPRERQILTNHMLGSMLVGGFVSVTIVSVVLAGIMVNWLIPATPAL